MKKRWVLALGSALLSSAVMAAPFGEEADIKYSQDLWSALSSAGLVGADAIMSTPYTGQHPHGAVLDTIDAKVSVGGVNDLVIIKRNYGGEGVSKQAVADNPSKYLQAVTVMYKRKGFDADNQDWFWVKYKPDGSLHVNPKGMQLAGAVAKGAKAGCIACHTAAPGGDMVFNHDRYAKGM
ncbi:cytochrome P460 family protein [Aestuariirhabdus sp. LZHN29]|uniref:cytochrome P460 family protein n=1 Tax=Aestuariirhabdus sp. LZHN29 TaxID=3417462 RepID=UPI003CF5DD34